MTAAVYLVLAGLLAAAAGARAPRGTGAFEWATQGSVPATRWKLLEAAGTSGWCIGAGVGLLALCVGMAFERGRRPRLRRLGLGTAHAVVQAALAITIAAFAVELAGLLDGVGRGVVYALVMALAGAFAANALLIGYLIVAARLGINLNAAAAAVASPHHKNFVRLHLTADGGLEVIPFVIERSDGDERELPARCERRRSYRLDPLRRLATSAPETSATEELPGDGVVEPAVRVELVPQLEEACELPSVAGGEVVPADVVDPLPQMGAAVMVADERDDLAVEPVEAPGLVGEHVDPDR
jgi:hypothetical protein